MDMMAPLIKGVLVPVAIAFTLYPLLNRKGIPGIALTALIAFAAAQIALTGMPSLPPVDAAQWTLFLLPVALVLGHTSRQWSATRRVPLLSAFLALTLYAWFQNLIAYSWSVGQAVAWIGSLSLAGSGIWLALDGAVKATPDGRALRWYLVALLSIQAFLLALSGSLLLAQLSGALAASIGPLALLPLRKYPLTPALASVVALVFISLTVSGLIFSELPLTSGVLLSLAVLVPIAIPQLLPNLQTKSRILVSAGTILFLALGAVTPILIALTQTPSSSYGY